MALISIIVPVYNTEKFVARCIDSILQQTFTDFKLILVDDGSVDNSGEIIDGYATKDERVYAIHKKNEGASVARNIGIDLGMRDSDIKWMTFVDSDDWIHPQYLETLLRAVEKDNTLISVCNIQRVDKMLPMKEINCSSDIEKSESLYLKYANRVINVSACGKMYNKKCFENIRYPEGKLWEDLATTYKLLFSVPYCSVINEALYFYYNNEDGVVKRSWSPQRLDEFEAYETQLKFFKQAEYKDIFDTLQLTYIKAISYSYFMLRKSSISQKEKKYYEKLLSRKMRIALNGYGGKLKFKENIGIYETAYPQGINMYWYIKGLLNKLRNRGN